MREIGQVIVRYRKNPSEIQTDIVKGLDRTEVSCKPEKGTRRGRQRRCEQIQSLDADGGIKFLVKKISVCSDI